MPTPSYVKDIYSVKYLTKEEKKEFKKQILSIIIDYYNRNHSELVIKHLKHISEKDVSTRFNKIFECDLKYYVYIILVQKYGIRISTLVFENPSNDLSHILNILHLNE